MNEGTAGGTVQEDSKLLGGMRCIYRSSIIAGPSILCCLFLGSNVRSGYVYVSGRDCSTEIDTISTRVHICRIVYI